MSANTYNKKDYPHEVTLRFRTEGEKHDFLAQLCDGWGENMVQMHWPWPEQHFYDCDDFGIDVFDYEEDDYEDEDDNHDIKDEDDGH